MKNSGIRGYLPVALCLCAQLLAFGQSTTNAAITVTGVIAPTYNGDDPWVVGGNLTIGDTGIGTLHIDDTSVINNIYGFLGVGTSSSGNATVSGAGSEWNNTLFLYVGYDGTGTLLIENGGTVSNSNSAIGRNPGSSGAATVDGAGSEWNNGFLGIGMSGAGVLNIENGGLVNNDSGSIGYISGSSGSVTVTGAGSIWNTTRLEAGRYGTGTLNIENSGKVNSTGANIGRISGSAGTVNITGVESVWNNSDFLSVGSSGTGSLNIENGGAFYSSGTAIGGHSGSTGTVNVTDTGSLWNNSDFLAVGTSGTGSLNIENGGLVNTSGIAQIGSRSDSTGTVNVIGAQSIWNHTNGLTVGLDGIGTLNIQDGGMVNVGDTIILGVRTGAIGTVKLSGGTLDIEGNDFTHGRGTAEFNFTGGTLLNAQTIDLNQPFVQDGGVLAPGGSIGRTHIFGDYTLNAGIVEIELGGVGNPHDVLTTTGDIDIALLGTTLDLPALGPMDAGTYTIIESTGGTVNGMFEYITGLGLYDGLIDVQYGTSAVTITLNSDYVPEPSAACLLGMGGLMLLKRGHA